MQPKLCVTGEDSHVMIITNILINSLDYWSSLVRYSAR